MADENKLRVRQGSDGNLYPYTHPDLILDENAESVTTKISNINNTIGKKKVNAYYVLDNTNGTLTVVDDSTDPIDPLTQVKLADVNGVASVGDKVNLVPEVGASGIFDYIDTAVTQAKLEGQDIDLSAYQKRIDGNLTTDDKNLVNVINALADDSHYHEAFTDTEIEQLFTDLTPTELEMYQNLINDQTISTNRIFSSQEVVNRITQALLDSQKYANDLVSGLSMVKAKKVETKPDTGVELTIYLVGTEGNYHQWMFIEGAWADLGSTNITLDGYITTEKLTEELAKKADDDKVLKLDKITTTMSGTPSNDNVLSELAIKNLLDGKADSTSIPTVTNDLTNDLKANYNAAYTHSQTTHFDGDYNNLTNKPTIPTPRTDDEIKTLADEQISKNQKNQLKDYYVKVVSNTDMSDFGIDDLSTLTSLLDLTKVLGYHVRFTIQVNAGASSTLFNSNVIPVDKAGLLILTCEYARGSAVYHTYDNIVYASSTDNSTTIEWKLWRKLCTTTVADVAKTNISLIDSTNYEITSDPIFSYYEIINGICYVEMLIKCISPVNGNSSAPGHLSLPMPRNSFHVSLPGSISTNDHITLFLGTNAQFFKYGTANGVYIAHFSYPVAES